MLYLVPTPIGNLKDVTLRALEILQSVDVILCEDTRTSSKFLQHYSIQKPLVPYHMHNEHKVVSNLVDEMAMGKNMALITDAGTPGVSDPAFLIVRECIKKDVKVESLPGATAFVPALVNSGLPTNRFCFEGFLPPKKGRMTLLKKLAVEERTMIIYESPMRLVKTLKEFITYFGAERQCSVSREITKMFEETKRGTLEEVSAYFQEKTVKGEIVIVLEGFEEK
ncbi:16S rRNA (cytidine(1402)-2'-O)-methyltransferase [Rhizosphaericola mali]|uniref:Ribosomal RNA small subunit methyltransferase I n=1 Tax=Rhizosphaericola mali TaxID=2545455 RepID=A0A5P2G9S7_9BACT|nr:16S rRNA (cytidine(1402)-2'-O)-methyltransferase [Rhizosphaericola mali]QES90450.1 16S rRNA (cytidine(1402)-2'-O)-methyltransferase [Rhizosphaericola mali]